MKTSKKKRQPIVSSPKHHEAYSAPLPVKWPDWKWNILFCVLLCVFVVGYFHPLTISGYEPGGADVIGSQGSAQQAKEWSKETGIRFMWNPAIFSGMPTYHNWGGIIWNLDTLVQRGPGQWLGYSFVFYLLGAIGMYFLLRYFHFHPLTCFFGALAFAFVVHWATLLQIGHFRKFRPLMLLPFILWAFLRALDRPNVMNFVLFAMIQACQVRTQHYQIIFYTALLLLFVGIYKLIVFIKNKQPLTMRVLLTFLALGLIVGMVVQPLFLMNEYAPYSIRGGTGDGDSDGLDMNYATSWSLHPGELMNLLIPRFFGGASGETYNVHNPQYGHLINQRMPGYWGHMPFTESTEYLGIVIFFFALIGMMAYWRNGFVKTLIILSVFSVFLAFGRHFPLFYKIFFTYIPQFNKFRVPAMILTLVQFIMVIFAGFGFHQFMQLFQQDDEERKKLLRQILIASGVLILIGVAALFVSGTLKYYRAQDLQQYQGQTLQMIKSVRKEFLIADAQRLIFFAIALFAVAFAFVKKWYRQTWLFALLAIGLLLFDLWQIQGRFLMEKVNGEYTHLHLPGNLEETHFKKTPTDKFLLAQRREDLEFAEYRIYPVAPNVWSTNDYSYYHQSIGGYNPAKMRIYQDLMDFGRAEGMGVFARNIPDMLNAKYFVTEFNFPSEYPFQNLTIVNGWQKQLVYQNAQACGRGWFVGEYVQAPTREERFNWLTNPQFDVHHAAILETELPQSIYKPANDSVFVKRLNPHELVLQTQNDSTSLLVVSEVYYPIGWKAFVDAQETPIYKTNHVLRSLVVPAGQHTVELKFSPPRLVMATRISLIVTILSFVLLGLGIFGNYRHKKIEVNVETFE